MAGPETVRTTSTHAARIAEAVAGARAVASAVSGARCPEAPEWSINLKGLPDSSDRPGCNAIAFSPPKARLRHRGGAKVGEPQAAAARPRTGDRKAKAVTSPRLNLLLSYRNSISLRARKCALNHRAADFAVPSAPGSVRRCARSTRRSPRPVRPVRSALRRRFRGPFQSG